MAVLSDADILRKVRDGTLGIEGFDEGHLTPNGYDVTIEQVQVQPRSRAVTRGTATVPPHSWFVIGTREFLRLPQDLVGEIWIRTSWARKGILSSFGRIDSGFNGNLTFSAFNASGGPVEIEIGARFAQVVFEELSSPPSKDYSVRSGNYQGQRGITLKPRRRKP
jgi:dCTP deaminase